MSNCYFVRIMRFFLILLAINTILLSSCSKAKNYSVNESVNSIDDQYEIAMDYLYGENGKRQDDHTAFVWFKKAADHGNVSAQNNIAILYATGRGVEKNEAMASYYFKLAADSNHPNGLVQTAKRLLLKNKNDEIAIAMLKKAADQKSNDAYIYLSDVYLKSNPAEGALWLEKSAEIGDSDSMVKLYHYLKSIGDNVGANKWLNLAVKYENKDAINIMELKE